MNRIVWIVALVLTSAGCIPNEGWDFGSPEPEPVEAAPQPDVRTPPRETEQPSPPIPAERTGNVTLVVEKVLVGLRDQSNLGAVWQYADEHVVVGGGHLARRNGIRVGGSTGGFRAAFWAAVKESRDKEVQKITLTTLSGTRGIFNVGEETYVEVLRYWTPLGRRVLFERTFIGSSLVVEPTILPDDKVRVRLHPRFTTRDGPAVDLSEVSTEVVLRHGQPMVIGALEESWDDAGFALFRWRRERETREVTLTLTPFIQGAP